MSAHATAAGHLALIAVDQGRASQLAPDTLVVLAQLGWANCLHTVWSLTATGRTALETANRAAAHNRIRNST